MIVCITGTFDVYKGAIKVGKEFVVSHGIDEFGNTVILPSEHPAKLGAVFNNQLGEYVIYEKGDEVYE